MHTLCLVVNLLQDGVEGEFDGKVGLRGNGVLLGFVQEDQDLAPDQRQANHEQYNHYRRLCMHYQYPFITFLYIMELRLEVDDQKFSISVGEGLGDFVWLATYGAKLYGNTKYPKGNYLPTLLRIQHSSNSDSLLPHPRMKIKQYLTQNNVDPRTCKIVINLRKANHHFTELQRIWQRQAFGKERDLMTLKFRYFADKLIRKKEFYFGVQITYKMYDEVKHIFKESDFEKVKQIKLNQQIINQTQSEFTTQLTLPLGQVSYCLLYYSKEDKNDDFKCVRLDQNTLRQNPKNIFEVDIKPQIPARATITEQVKQMMKIQEGISKSLQEKQQQTKKKANNSALCCYTFEELWTALQEYNSKTMLSKFEESTINKVKIVLEKNLDKLYEVFSYYFIVHMQQKEKKEDLVITFQDVMHCIKFYGILQDAEVMNNFFDYYNMDGRIRSVADTLKLENGIKFPQFISILLKVTQFIQTISLMDGSLTFDQSVQSEVISKIISKQAQEADKEKFTPFHRNLREQIKIIQFFRSHCSEFASVFIQQIQDSIQTKEDTYFMMKQELKVLLKLIGIPGDYDSIINDCYNELFPDQEKQKRFQYGICFYELLQIIQWLAIVLVENQEGQEQEEDEERQVETMVKKSMFLLKEFSKYK